VRIGKCVVKVGRSCQRCGGGYARLKESCWLWLCGFCQSVVHAEAARRNGRGRSRAAARRRAVRELREKATCGTQEKSSCVPPSFDASDAARDLHRIADELDPGSGE
jgi:hypothetical protein